MRCGIDLGERGNLLQDLGRALFQNEKALDRLLSFGEIYLSALRYKVAYYSYCSDARPVKCGISLTVRRELGEIE